MTYEQELRELIKGAEFIVISRLYSFGIETLESVPQGKEELMKMVNSDGEEEGGCEQIESFTAYEAALKYYEDRSNDKPPFVEDFGTPDDPCIDYYLRVRSLEKWTRDGKGDCIYGKRIEGI